jgi:hypothetical protein
VQTSPGGGSDTLRHTTVAEALELPAGDDWYAVLADAASGLEYLRHCRELHERGLYVELAAYELHVFIDIRQVAERADRRYARLAARLDGRGVPSVDEALAELELEPVLEPYRRLVAPELLGELLDLQLAGPEGEEPDAAGVLDRVEAALEELLDAIRNRIGGEPAPGLARAIRDDLLELLAGDRGAALRSLVPPPAGGSPLPPAALAWVLLRRLADGAPEDAGESDLGRWLDGWFLLSSLRRSLVALGLGAAADRAAAAVRALDACRGWWCADEAGEPFDLAERASDLLAEPAVAAFLGINRYNGVEWFIAEAWDELQYCLAVAAVVEAGDPVTLAEVSRRLELLEAARQASGYQVDGLLVALAADPG